jgi:hypothetical protein
MLKKFSDWLDICKTHWKEIFALSFMLHFVMDLLIIGPLFFLLGYFFGVNIETGH